LNGQLGSIATVGVFTIVVTTVVVLVVKAIFSLRVDEDAETTGSISRNTASAPTTSRPE